MKKLNPRVISIAMVLLTLLTAGGFAAKEVIAPGNGGIMPDPNPDPSG